jgi:hypothetical protein
MPFKSRAQRRKFAELLLKGEISDQTYEEWNRETGSKELPERVKSKAKKKTSATRKTSSKKKKAPASKRRKSKAVKKRPAQRKAKAKRRAK